MKGNSTAMDDLKQREDNLKYRMGILEKERDGQQKRRLEEARARTKLLDRYTYGQPFLRFLIVLVIILGVTRSQAVPIFLSGVSAGVNHRSVLRRVYLYKERIRMKICHEIILHYVCARGKVRNFIYRRRERPLTIDIEYGRHIISIN